MSTEQSILGKIRFCRKIADSFRTGKRRPRRIFLTQLTCVRAGHKPDTSGARGGVTDKRMKLSRHTLRRPRPWVDTVGNTASGQSGRMPAVETVAGGIGGDDALNADLLGSLRDTVRHRDFSRHPSDCKSPVNVTTVAPDVPIPAPTRASPSQADNPNRSHTRRACIISRRSLTSSRNTRVCRKTTQVRCEPTTRDGCFFGPFATTTRRGAAISGADSEGWRSPRPRPGTRASSDRHRAPSDIAKSDRARSRSPTLR